MLTINTYTHQFIANCPNNGVPILYTFTIRTAGRVIPVEQIVLATAGLRGGFHETLADLLYERFGERQTLRAFHHGVDIETIRDGA